MYKALTKSLRFFTNIACISFLFPVIGLLPGKRGTSSLYHYNKTGYVNFSLIGIVIAILSLAIFIMLKKTIKHMDCKIKSLRTYTAPVTKYKMSKGKYSVVFNIDGKKYKHEFDTIEVIKVYDLKKGSCVSYRTYKDEVIAKSFYLALPRHTKGIKNKWAYLNENQ
jgi:hypothetical protein